MGRPARDLGESGLRERIIAAVRSEAEVSELLLLFRCSRTTLNSRLHELVQDGVLERVRVGVYRRRG